MTWITTVTVELTFDSELTMQRHVNDAASICFHHIRLDYCNALLAGLPRSTVVPLQRARNVAARLIARLSPRDHVTSTLRELHWLPVQYDQITYKLCLLMHLI